MIIIFCYSLLHLGTNKLFLKSIYMIPFLSFLKNDPFHLSHFVSLCPSLSIFPLCLLSSLFCLSIPLHSFFNDFWLLYPLELQYLISHVKLCSLLIKLPEKKISPLIIITCHLFNFRFEKCGQWKYECISDSVVGCSNSFCVRDSS